MKHYDKPTVEIYSLRGNESICGGCSVKLRDNKILNETFLFYDGVDSDGDGALSKTEAARLFGSGENCTVKIEQYCKFTSTGPDNLLSWS